MLNCPLLELTTHTLIKRTFWNICTYLQYNTVSQLRSSVQFCTFISQSLKIMCHVDDILWIGCCKLSLVINLSGPKSNIYVCQYYINILVECDGVQGVLRNLRSSKDVNLNDGEGDSPSQEKLTGSDSQDLESGHQPRKRKTSQNAHSHGSFFLRVGAIGEFMHVRGSSGFYFYHRH